MPALKVTLGGKAVDPMLIKYAGLTPGCGGLYQINLVVPDGTWPTPKSRSLQVVRRSCPC
jgi:uncharacterized protein (TIGR03437 family)